MMNLVLLVVTVLAAMAALIFMGLALQQRHTPVVVDTTRLLWNWGWFNPRHFTAAGRRYLWAGRIAAAVAVACWLTLLTGQM